MAGDELSNRSRNGNAEDPSPEECRLALDRVLGSREFRRSERLRGFLEFAVRHVLAGAPGELKEHTIATEAYGRALDHDSHNDPIVRVEARRLRDKLARYYEREGREDRVRIGMPKGSYVPEFRWNASPGARRLRRPVSFAWAAATAALATGVIVGYRALDESREQPAQPPQRVLVLPVDAGAPASDEAAYAYAIADAIRSRLLRVDDIDVVPASTTEHLLARVADPVEAAQRSGATLAVTARLRRGAGRCDATVRIVRAADGQPISSHELDCEGALAVEFQRKVAEHVLDALSLGGAKAAGRVDLEPTPDPEAYDAFVRGRFAAIQFNNTRLEIYLETAERRLQESIARDPRFSPALLALARLQLARLYPPRGARPQVLARARDYLEQAARLASDQITTLTLRSELELETGEQLRALELARRAVSLAPREPDALRQLAACYGALGFYEAALREYRRAAQEDPLFGDTYAFAAWHASRLGRWREAHAFADGLRDAIPAGPVADFIEGEVHYRSGQLEEAGRLWQRGRASLRDAGEASYLTIALALLGARQGDTAQARVALRSHRASPIRLFDHLIELAVLLGDHDLALHRIEEHPRFYNYRWLVTQGGLAPLGRDPRFQALARRLHERWLNDSAVVGVASPVPVAAVPHPEPWLRQLSH